MQYSEPKKFVKYDTIHVNNKLEHTIFYFDANINVMKEYYHRKWIKAKPTYVTRDMETSVFFTLYRTSRTTCFGFVYMYYTSVFLFIRKYRYWPPTNKLRRNLCSCRIDQYPEFWIEFTASKLLAVVKAFRTGLMRLRSGIYWNEAT